MRSRRVPVLTLGSRGPGGDAKSLRCVRKASAKRSQSVRKASAIVRNRSQRVGHAGESTESKIVAKRRTVVTFYVSHYKSVNSHGDRGGRGVVVAKRRTVVTFGLVLHLRVSKVSTVTGIGGVVVSWSRNAELSSLLDSSCIFASQKCQQSQGSGGVVVAKRRTVVTFGLVSALRVSKVSTVTGIAGVVVSRSRNAELSSLLDSSRLFAFQKCQQSRGSGGSWCRGRETQNCRHFWTRLASSRFKSVNSHGDRGGRGVVVAKRRTVVTFGLAFRERKGERRERRKER